MPKTGVMREAVAALALPVSEVSPLIAARPADAGLDCPAAETSAEMADTKPKADARPVALPVSAVAPDAAPLDLAMVFAQLDSQAERLNDPREVAAPMLRPISTATALNTLRAPVVVLASPDSRVIPPACA
jgi:hypothetical protein